MIDDYLSARMDRWVEVAKDRASRAEGMRHLYHHPNTPPHEKAAAEQRLKAMGEPLGDPAHYNRTQQRTRRPNPPPGARPGGGYQPPPRPGGGGHQPPPHSGGPGFNADDFFRANFGRSSGEHERSYGESRFKAKKRAYQSFAPTRVLREGKGPRRGLAGVAVGGGLLTAAAGYRGYKKMPQVKGMNEAESKRRRSGTREVVGGAGLMTGGTIGLAGADITNRHARHTKTWKEALHGSPIDRGNPGYREAHQAFSMGAEGRHEAAAAKKLVRINRATVGGSAAAGLGGLALMVHGGNRANAAERDMRNRRKREKKALR